MTKKKVKRKPYGPKPHGIGHKFTIQIYLEDEPLLDQYAESLGRSRAFVIREMLKEKMRHG